MTEITAETVVDESYFTANGTEIAPGNAVVVEWGNGFSFEATWAGYLANGSEKGVIIYRGGYEVLCGESIRPL